MISAVIVAGGSGRRMKAALKKQYLALGDFPVVVHTLMAFDRHAAVDRIVLVVPKEEIVFCREKIVSGVVFDHDVQIVGGGKRRQDSVFCGLEALAGDDAVVMIHDGVRPFVRPSLIDACLSGLEKTGACIPALTVTDTVKTIDANNVVVTTVNRRQIRLAQTPQTFSLPLIRRAHAHARRENFEATDDASIAEFAGERVVVVPGDRENIKITHPDDLEIARLILARRSGSRTR